MKLRECIYSSVIFLLFGQFIDLVNIFLLRLKINRQYWLSDAQSVDVYHIINILSNFFILLGFYFIASGLYSIRKNSYSILLLKTILSIFTYGKLIRFMFSLFNKSYICGYEFCAYAILLVIALWYGYYQIKKS